MRKKEVGGEMKTQPRRDSLWSDNRTKKKVCSGLAGTS